MITLVAGHGNDGAQRPKDREDAEHARHGASVGFRSQRWRLRLSASLACRGYVPGVPWLRHWCFGRPPVDRTTFQHAGRRACAIHHAPKAGQAAARLAEHNVHAGLVGISSSRRGPAAAERPAGERPGRCREAWCRAWCREARPLRGPAATERPGRYEETRKTCQPALLV